METYLTVNGIWQLGDARFEAASGRSGESYSGLISEVPEYAATMAGEISIPTKARARRRSCMVGGSLVGVVINP
jgi:hypothetical protein